MASQEFKLTGEQKPGLMTPMTTPEANQSKNPTLTMTKQQTGLSTPVPPATPTVTPNEVSTVITSDQLESSAGGDINLPPTFTPQRFEPNVPAVASEGSPEQKELSKLQSENVKLRDDVKSGLDSLAGQGRFEEQVAEQVGLDKKRELKTEIDNKIMRKSRDFDLALRAVEDRFGTVANKNAEKQVITRDYNRQLADLSIIQMARAGEFNDAQTTVNRKVELEFQDRRAKLDGLVFLYENNKDRLTLVEQRQFDQTIKKEQRQYDKDTATAKQLEDMKLTMLINATEAGAGNATLEAIQGAKDTKGLLSLPNAGVYTKSKADRLAEQLQGINIAKANRDLNESATVISSSGVSPITGKPFNAEQVKAGTFSVRMEDAEKTLSGGRGFFVPFVPDFAKSGERRQFEQAEANFITAVLRKESGAAIAESEFEDAKKVYIPKATDDEITLANKARERKTAIQALKAESVGAYDQLKASQDDSSTNSTTSYLDEVDKQLSNPYDFYISYENKNN